MPVAHLLQRSAWRCLDMVLPPRCLGCGDMIEGTDGLCADCWRRLTFLGSPHCRHCGYPLPHSVAAMPVCGVCAIEPPVYDRARAALRYDDAASGMILRFKHADRTDIARLFGRMMSRAGADLLAACDILAPVPLHRWRLLKRGYNQAALLAAAIASGSERPMVPDLLQRIRSTASQQGLSGQQRRQNITGNAFRLHPWHGERVLGKRVLLIDDVLTTGATVTACARALGKAGASAVDVLTLARVVRDKSATISSEDPTGLEPAVTDAPSPPTERERQNAHHG